MPQWPPLNILVSLILLIEILIFAQMLYSMCTNRVGRFALAGGCAAQFLPFQLS